jgi:hypothetical protein
VITPTVNVNPSPPSNVFTAVDARTSTDAWVVGTYQNPVDDAGGTILAEHWNGTAWSAAPTPDIFRSDEKLNAVSAAAVVAALQVGAGIYNVGDDEPLRRREFYDSLGRAVGGRTLKLPPAWLAKVTGSLGATLSRSLRISNRKLRDASGWSPRFPSARDGWRMVVDSLHHVDRGTPTMQGVS